MSKTRVVHVRQPHDVYIGRPGKWGNPFIIGRDGSRKQVIEKYRQLLLTSPKLVRDARRALRGKRLGCFCKPLRCHGDILAAIANGEDWT